MKRRSNGIACKRRGSISSLKIAEREQQLNKKEKDVLQQRRKEHKRKLKSYNLYIFL
jgi:hypothetical protein